MYNFLLLSAPLSCTMISRQFLLTFQMLEQMNLKNYPLSQGSTEAITVELPFSDFFFLHDFTYYFGHFTDYCYILAEFTVLS